MNDQDRRHFLISTGVLIGAATLGSGRAMSADHQHKDAGMGMVIDANATSTCGTCRFWGGMRKLSKDRSQITAQSMGWCNNPDSPNYQKLTAADHKMKKAGIWKQWSVL